LDDRTSIAGDKIDSISTCGRATFEAWHAVDYCAFGLRTPLEIFVSAVAAALRALMEDRGGMNATT